jgi:hypothetical protein
MSGKSTDYRHRQVKIEGQFSDSGDPAKPTSRSLKALKVAQTLVAHGADVNQRDDVGRTPLHEACAHDWHELVSFLLSRGADPLAKDDMIHRPEIKPRHLRGMTVHFEASLAANDRAVLENCLSAIEKCMPRRSAVSVLLEWAGLAVHHQEAAARIHGIIEKNLPKGELLSFDPRHRLATYAIRYDCNEMREEALSKLKQAGLALKGMGKDFVIEGAYSSEKHGLLAINLARAWLHDPDSDTIYPLAILSFVQMEAMRDGSPETRSQLANDVTDLAAELYQSPFQVIAGRWAQVLDIAIRL